MDVHPKILFPTSGIGKDITMALTTMRDDVKKNILINVQIGNPNKKIEAIRSYQKESYQKEIFLD